MMLKVLQAVSAIRNLREPHEIVALDDCGHVQGQGGAQFLPAAMKIRDSARRALERALCAAYRVVRLSVRRVDADLEAQRAFPGSCKQPLHLLRGEKRRVRGDIEREMFRGCVLDDVHDAGVAERLPAAQVHHGDAPRRDLVKEALRFIEMHGLPW